MTQNDESSTTPLKAAKDKGLGMAGVNEWRMRRRIARIAKQLAKLYKKHPRNDMQAKLTETSWSYREWAFFYAAKDVAEGLIGEPELVKLTRAAEGDFRDFLLLFSIRADPHARKAIFLSQEAFKRLLTIIVEVVLESVPGEFQSDNWLETRSDAGAKAFNMLYSDE